MTLHFTKENFQKDVLEASAGKPVLVDFFAGWCGPCKVQGPIIDEVAEEAGAKAFVGKFDTESGPELASQYGVMSIPNILIFREGKIVENLVGLHSKEALMEFLEKHI